MANTDLNTLNLDLNFENLDLKVAEPTALKEELKTETTFVPAPAVQTQMTTVTNSMVDAFMAVDPTDAASTQKVTALINDFGSKEVAAIGKYTPSVETRTSTTLVGLKNKEQMIGTPETANIANSLEDLALNMRELDPSNVFDNKGIFHKLTNTIERYFKKYEKVDATIAGIVDSLVKGKKTLLNDNKTLEVDIAGLKKAAADMEKKIVLGQEYDTALTEAIETARANGENPDKIKFLEEEVLFTLREKIEDFQQIYLVAIQGALAMEIIRRNNKELIRSVERAENVTIMALRTAVTVAEALYNQKIVLEKVKLVNQVTNDMIQSTSKLLNTQGVEIQKQATETAITPDTLKIAFQNTFDALDQISTFRQNALPVMAETINEFNAIAIDAKARLERMSNGVQMSNE